MKNNLVLIFSLLLFHCSNPKRNNIKFDSNEWLQNDGGALFNDTRLNMTDDLIKSEILINK